MNKLEFKQKKQQQQQKQKGSRMEFTDEEIIKVVDELNDFMGWEFPIEIKGRDSQKRIIKKIINKSKDEEDCFIDEDFDLSKKEDSLSIETYEFLVKIGAEVPKIWKERWEKKDSQKELQSTQKKEKRRKGEKNTYLEMLVGKKTHKKEVLQKMMERFGGKLSTLKTLISDSKNIKYNRLKKLVVEENGFLTFKKEVEK